MNGFICYIYKIDKSDGHIVYRDELVGLNAEVIKKQLLKNYDRIELIKNEEFDFPWFKDGGFPKLGRDD